MKNLIRLVSLRADINIYNNLLKIMKTEIKKMNNKECDEEYDDLDINIILISGKRRCGKDTCATILNEFLSNNDNIIAYNYSFAHRVKEFCSDMYNLELQRLFDDNEYKEQHRHLLIKHGMEEREKDKYIWVKLAFEHILNNIKDKFKINRSYKNKKYIILISDFRFLSEVDFLINKLGALSIYKIRVNSTEEERNKRGWVYNEKIDTSLSECELDIYDNWDLIIDNNSTKNELNQILSNFGNEIIN
jgi:phosphomevalonate kinase